MNTTFHKWLDEQAKKAGGIRRQHLEELAAAYLTKTNVPPDEVELVETTRGTQTTWFFRRRGQEK